MNLQLKTILTLFLIYSSKSYTQNSIGCSIGINQSTFFSLKKDPRSTFYPKTGLTLNAYFEQKVDERFAWRAGVQYDRINAGLSYKDLGSVFYQTNQSCSYAFNQYSVGFTIVPTLVQFKKSQLNFMIGVIASGVIKTHLISNGWEYESHQEILYPNTLPQDVSSSSNWSIDNKHSNAIAPRCLGVNLGFEYGRLISEKLDLTLQNKYILNFQNRIKQTEFNPFMFLTGSFTVGVKYKMDKKER